MEIINNGSVDSTRFHELCSEEEDFHIFIHSLQLLYSTNHCHTPGMIIKKLHTYVAVPFLLIN